MLSLKLSNYLSQQEEKWEDPPTRTPLDCCLDNPAGGSGDTFISYSTDIPLVYFWTMNM